MWNLTKASLSGLCVIGILSIASAQQQQNISEDDVSMEILKWFYDDYPNGEAQWSKIISKDGDQYQASIKFNGEVTEVRYTTTGLQVRETKYLDKQLPMALKSLLDRQFDKYKVSTFAQVTEPENQFHELVIKVQSEFHTLRFDQDLSPIPDSNGGIAVGN
ncbi:MAG: hypothetical protein KI790_19715 [Cyclobacteriaceae bacterium]|nr:hypothetical protein [Cyclobacteriaceae bacterium HetDA_MAG_MS6]